MNNYYNAFEKSPVPAPGPGATAPEPFRGIYGMPMFVSIPSEDLAASVEFWEKGLGFFDLFSIPGSLVHLRRWAFQDVLLVPAEPNSASRRDPSPIRVSFAAIETEIAGIAAACENLRPGCTNGPFTTPWNTIDVEVTTPDGTIVVMTAATQWDTTTAESQEWFDAGILSPDSPNAPDSSDAPATLNPPTPAQPGDNGLHDQ